MPSIDSRSISARVNNQLADRFTAIAESRGYSTAGLIADFIQRTVDDMDVTRAEEPAPELPETETRLYGVALSLVDDLVEEGYPESEIAGALNGIRREML